MTSFADRFAPFDLAYLDAASQGPLPLAAVRAGREALALKERPYRIPSGLALTLTAEVRALYSRLFSCREEAVALTTGAGAAVNAVARGLDWKEGDEVVLPDGEFPSNDWPWRLLARCGVRVVRVKPPERAIAVTAEGLAAALTPRTRVVAFAHVSYLHGGRLDPAPVVAAARAAGALTLVDGSQAAGAVPFDFGASGVDVYTACAYKHLLGPYGSAVALFSPAALERLGSGDLAWQSVKGSEDVSRLPRGELELRPGAVRFDAHEAATHPRQAAGRLRPGEPARARPAQPHLVRGRPRPSRHGRRPRAAPRCQDSGCVTGRSATHLAPSSQFGRRRRAPARRPRERVSGSPRGASRRGG